MFCWHDLKNRCKERDGHKGRCKECDGSGLCPHRRVAVQCKECGGSGLCGAEKASLTRERNREVLASVDADLFEPAPRSDYEDCEQAAWRASRFCKGHSAGPEDSALHAMGTQISKPHLELILPTSAAVSAATTSAPSPFQTPSPLLRGDQPLSQPVLVRDLDPSEVINLASQAIIWDLTIQGA